MRILSLFACMSICNSFVIHKKVSRPKVRLYNSNPSEIIKNIGSMGIGDEWTYQTFLDNLNSTEVSMSTKVFTLFFIIPTRYLLFLL